MVSNTFSDRLKDFYSNIKEPPSMPWDIKAMNPYQDKEAMTLVRKFADQYFNDNKRRTLIMGINPGRFGGGATGINFTDAYALDKFCGIENILDKRRELSSVFIYDVISAYGGPEAFYQDFFLSALSPLGFVKNGLNYNYYDDPGFIETIRPYILENIKKQILLGINTGHVIILGTGKNKRFFDELNHKEKLFLEVSYLEHPRYIMQYKRRSFAEYLGKYLSTLNKSK